jgi:hypothetical protein
MIFFAVLIYSCKCIKQNKPIATSGNFNPECESIPRIIKNIITLWEGWAIKLKQVNLLDQMDIKSKYTIAKTEILDYTKNLASAFPDPLKVKSIKIIKVNIENFTFLADSLILGPHIITHDLIDISAREEDKKFDDVINACIKITNDCKPKISFEIVKDSLNKITMKDYKDL